MSYEHVIRIRAEREAAKQRILASIVRKHEGEGPTNEDRAAWAHKALEAFAFQTGLVQECADHSSNWDDGCLGVVAGDLIANIFHLARVNGVDPQSLVDRGFGHFNAEEDEENEDSEGEES